MEEKGFPYLFISPAVNLLPEKINNKNIFVDLIFCSDFIRVAIIYCIRMAKWI
jgi:hypothetical protein